MEVSTPPWVPGGQQTNSTDSYTEVAVPVNSSSSIEQAKALDTISTQVLLWAMPIIFVLGLVGNTLTFLVLWSKDFQHSTIRWTISALTIADTASLVLRLLPEWIFLLIGRDFVARYNSMCKMYFFSWYFIPHVCSWMVVLVTMERTFSVWTPLKAKALCGSRSIKITITTIVLGLAAVNAPLLGAWRVVTTLNNNNNQTVYSCSVGTQWEYFFENVWYWADVSLVSLLPLAMIVTCNTIIIWKLRNLKRMRLKLVANGQDVGNSFLLSTVVMLVVASLVFLVTTLPSTAYYLLQKHWLAKNSQYIEPIALARLYLIAVICNLLFYVNNSINFLLYCLSGSYFRRTLSRLVARKFHRKYSLQRGPSYALASKTSRV